MEDKVSSINVKESTKKKIREHELHHRESYEEIILRLCKKKK